MAASYARAPQAWVETSGGSPQDNIAAEPAGTNKKLVVVMCTEDGEVWDISTMTVGGVSATTAFDELAANNNQIAVFEWNQTDIDFMSGVAISYADVSQFINPLDITHYWVQDTDQAAAVQTSTSTNPAATGPIVTSVSSVSGDLVVAVGNTDANGTTLTWDTLSLDEAIVGATSWMGIASANNTSDSSHSYTYSGSHRVLTSILVHAQLAGSSSSYSGSARGVMRGVGRGLV